jgi:hypothetical protein
MMILCSFLVYDDSYKDHSIYSLLLVERFSYSKNKIHQYINLTHGTLREFKEFNFYFCLY